MVYLKFDFSDSELEQFPLLKKTHDSQCCIRTTLIVCVENIIPSTRAENAVIVLNPSEYSVLKVPSLEGEELWITAHSTRAQFEKLIGLKSPLEELFHFPHEKIASLEVIHPVSNEKIKLSVNKQTSDVHETGSTISEMNLTKETIDDLRQSGHLVFTMIK